MLCPALCAVKESVALHHLLINRKRESPFGIVLVCTALVTSQISRSKSSFEGNRRLREIIGKPVMSAAQLVGQFAFLMDYSIFSAQYKKTCNFTFEVEAQLKASRQTGRDDWLILALRRVKPLRNHACMQSTVTDSLGESPSSQGCRSTC